MTDDSDLGRPDPARVVADADVLTADLLVGGAAREAMDAIRAHSWVELVASDPLLDDAEAVIRTCADDGLARDWRERIETLRISVDHPPGDHPGLASAYQSNAAHLLSFDETLTSAAAGSALNRRLSLSIRTPDAFLSVFDPEKLYPVAVGGTYPGPDLDPRV